MTPNPFSFWPLRMCLTMGGAEWAICQTELAKAVCHVERFDSLPDIGPHQSFNKSFRAMLQKFYDSGLHSCLILEDDVEFRHLDQLWPALQELPADWDVFYLGGNIRSDAWRVTDRIYRVTDVWTTHAVAFCRPVVKHILDNQPDFSAEMIDNWIGREVLPKYNVYICKPFCAIQRPRRSAIWSTYTDYRQIFIDSEKKCV